MIGDTSIILAGLEIGTSKVRAAVAELHADGCLEVLGVGQAASPGVRQGEVCHVQEAQGAVRQAIAEVERTASVDLRCLFLGITGSHIASFTSRGVLDLPGPPRCIQEADVQEAVRNAKAIQLPEGAHVIHAVRRHFAVDGQECIINPAGMVGSRLEAFVHIVHGRVERLKLAIDTVKGLQLEVEDIVFSGLASSLALLTPEQKQLGALVIDLGAGVADYVVYTEGIIEHTGVVTNAFRAPDIGQLPVEDVFRAIAREPATAGALKRVRAGVFLCGGRALDPRAVGLAEEIFENPCRVGKLAGMHDLNQVLDLPEFATVLGLLKFASFKSLRAGSSSSSAFLGPGGGGGAIRLGPRRLRLRDTGNRRGTPPAAHGGIENPPPPAAGEVGKAAERTRQGQLPLEIRSRGRFDKTEPNMHAGEDLDVPTYLRKEPGAAQPSTPADAPISAGGKSDLLRFSVTLPPSVTPDSSFVVDVWAHLEHQRQEVLKRAREEARGAAVSIKSKGPVKVARGTTLSVSLRIAGMKIQPPEDAVQWEGEIGNATFSVAVPESAAEGIWPGLVKVRIGGLPIARVDFLVKVAKQATPMDVLPVNEHRYRTAFASYADQDRDAVLARVQGMQKVAPGLDVFLASARLRSGDRWQERLRQEILARDVMFLFWSEAARQSRWVDWEWRTGLQARGIDFIDPCPLAPPEEVPPPRDLADELHFNDWTLAWRRPLQGSAPP